MAATTVAIFVSMYACVKFGTACNFMQTCECAKAWKQLDFCNASNKFKVLIQTNSKTLQTLTEVV